MAAEAVYKAMGDLPSCDNVLFSLSFSVYLIRTGPFHLTDDGLERH